MPGTLDHRRTTLETQEESDSDASSALVFSCVFPTPGRAVATLSHGLTLGRDETCDLQLEGRGVSRRHAVVSREGPIFTIRDLDSRNGTFVDGRPVSHEALGEGAIVRVGDWVATVERVRSDWTFDTDRWTQFNTVGGIVDDSAALVKAAASSMPIVLLGETGTGKEVLARAIHEWSRRSGPFCAINCGAIPRELAESELFGFRRGAFSGAERANPGHIRSAHQGTLLLDEISDLPLAVQTKLLRVLQEGEVTPLGDSTPVRVDVRIVVAGQRNLAAEVVGGRFREDLWMRLRGLEVELLPLRERLVDVGLLFSHFARQYTQNPHRQPPSVEGRLIERLCLHDWPGNVRELELVTQRLIVLHGSEAILRRRHLPDYLVGELPTETAVKGSRRDNEANRLRAALIACNGNLSAASRDAGISRQRAYRVLDGRTIQQFLAEAATSHPPDTRT